MRRTFMRRSGSLLVAALVIVGLDVGQAQAASWEDPGPYSVTVQQGGPDHTLYYPTNLGAGGFQHPVIIWGNGTGATPAPYDFALRHLASWGFVVAAANTTQSGSGQEMLAGARFLIAEDSRAGSVFYGKIDENSIGASGHSQGGGGAIAAGADPLVKTTVPVQPGPQGSTTNLKGPSFFVAGQIDFVVPSFYVRWYRYAPATQIPAVFGELRGADHAFSAGDSVRKPLLGAVTAWFRFWLMNDEQARGVFFGPSSTCGICNNSAWSAVARNARALAIPGTSSAAVAS